MRRTYFPSSSYVLCKGHCGKHVPAWVTPEKCRHCVNIRKCVQCNGPAKQSKLNGMCLKCYAIEYPTRICSCGSSFTAHKSFANCENCNKKIQKKAFMDKLGPIHPDYAIKVKITGTEYSHRGYCSDSYRKTSSKASDTMYFSAPTSFVDDINIMNSSITSMINLDRFTTSSCYCQWGQTKYDDVSFKLVHKLPHMDLCEWSIFL
jgi:hypothetical protein